MNVREDIIDSRWPVSIVRVGGHSDTSPHDHDFHELVLVLRGSGVHFTKDESYVIQAGDVFLIPPGYEHGYKDTCELDLVNILYSLKRMDIPNMDIRDIPGYHAFFEIEPETRRSHGFKSRLTLSAGALREASAVVREIEEELNSRRLGRYFMVLSHFMRLQCLIARSYDGEFSRDNGSLMRLADVLAFVERHHARSISLAELAGIAHVSPSTLHRGFIETIGVSPIEFLIRTRVLKGAELLRGGDVNVSEAAFAAGFNDSNYFSRQFRRIMGMPPRKYAANYRRVSRSHGERRT